MLWPCTSSVSFQLVLVDRVREHGRELRLAEVLTVATLSSDLDRSS
jgi:hypothetical protein